MDKESIYTALADFLPSDKIRGVQIDPDGSVLFSILVDPMQGTKMEETRQKAERVVAALNGVSSVMVVLTSEKPAESVPANDPPNDQHIDPHGMSKNPRLKLPIKKIVVVASGKGGVGKSTVAVNLAAAMARGGKSVGLLDADIYGPSVPKLVGLPFRKPDMNEEKQLLPFEAHGMKVMSMGFMVEPEKAMIWRGPMVQSAIYQMLRDVHWGTEAEPLDVLVIDMPPGTGDAQLTLAQKVEVDGAIIVSTPQDIALMDAVKAIEMFRTTKVPILGLIENMSTHICTNCGHEEHIFGHHGAKAEAEKQGINFLGEIPLSLEIRENSDQGKITEEFFDKIAASLF